MSLWLILSAYYHCIDDHLWLHLVSWRHISLLLPLATGIVRHYHHLYCSLSALFPCLAAVTSHTTARSPSVYIFISPFTDVSVVLLLLSVLWYNNLNLEWYFSTSLLGLKCSFEHVDLELQSQVCTQHNSVGSWRHYLPCFNLAVHWISPHIICCPYWCSSHLWWSPSLAVSPCCSQPCCHYITNAATKLVAVVSLLSSPPYLCMASFVFHVQQYLL